MTLAVPFMFTVDLPNGDRIVRKEYLHRERIYTEVAAERGVLAL